MTETLTLSRYRLAAFLTCPRRFELRFLRRLPWPAAPLDARTETARQQGDVFHQLMERHFLGLPIIAEAIQDTKVKRWWSLYQSSGPKLPDGEAYPERSLTVPVGKHVVNGRFDLIILHQNSAHIFDWKTGRPQSEANLRRDWQTRLYLAMLAESGQALGTRLDPNHISITYWYVNEPDVPRTIHYSQTWHEQNWGDIQEIVAQIDAQLVQDEWPLTEDLDACRHCAYQAYCGRHEAGQANVEAGTEHENDAANLFLEPDLP